MKELFVSQPDGTVLREQGVDALVFMKFTRGAGLLLALICVFSVVLLIPINVVGGDNARDNTTVVEVRGIDATSVSNLPDDSILLWAHVAAMFATTVIVWLFLIRMYRQVFQ